MDFIRRSLSPKWSTGLCDCGVNKTTCLITYCLPCITYGQIAETLDGGKTSCCGQGCLYALLMTVQFHWILSCLKRKKLRSKYGLPDEPCCNCCVHYCCEQCALCQEYAELKHSLGPL